MEEPAGSIRNSHRDTNPIRKKYAQKRQAEAARALVDGCSTSGPIIRQRLDIERMKQPLQKGLFYVIENDGVAEPGFLVFLPGQAPIFLQTKTRSDHPCTLRMRVSPTLGEGGGSILVATLDTIQHTLRIEDVWMWKGQPIFDTTPYSKRRAHLTEFVERCWIPDARLMGGITTTILNPRSVKDLLESPASSVSTIEFIPEMAGKRRMWLGVGGQPALGGQSATTCALKPPSQGENFISGGGAAGSATTCALKPPSQGENCIGGGRAAGAPPPPSDKTFTRAVAKPVDKMPDVYDLCDEVGRIIGRGSVQRFSLSQTLRSRQTDEGVLVDVQWRDEFDGYEIISIR